MDNNRFVNLETFEVVDHIPKYIIADKDIAKAIAILNKKGYITKASCSGHFYQFTKGLQRNIELDLLEEAKKHDIYSIDEIRDDSFDCWITHTITSIYVMFDKKYDFVNLPERFELENDGCIRCTIELLNDGKRKKDKEILNEIEKYNKILEDWASNLPKIN